MRWPWRKKKREAKSESESRTCGCKKSPVERAVEKRIQEAKSLGIPDKVCKILQFANTDHEYEFEYGFNNITFKLDKVADETVGAVGDWIDHHIVIEGGKEVFRYVKFGTDGDGEIWAYVPGEWVNKLDDALDATREERKLADKKCKAEREARLMENFGLTEDDLYELVEW